MRQRRRDILWQCFAFEIIKIVELWMFPQVFGQSSGSFFVGFSESSVPNLVNLRIKISPNFLQDLQRVFNQFKDTKHCGIKVFF